MSRLAAVLALALALGGCDLIYDDCLYDDVGCDLPGDWRLVSLDGAAASGRFEIAEGFVDRDTYAVLPTGNATYPEMRGAASGSYALDPDTPQRFDLTLWRMDVHEGAVYVDLYGRVAEIDGDRMTYVVVSSTAKIIYAGGASNRLAFPSFAAGTELVFER